MSTPPPVWPPQQGSPSPYGAPQSNSNATLILVLGILSIFCFGIILGPIAWILGNNALKSGYVDPSQAGQISAGRICGIIGTVLSILSIIYYIAVFGFVLAHPGALQRNSSFPPQSAPAPTSGQ